MANVKELVDAVGGKLVSDEQLKHGAVEVAAAILQDASKRQKLSERYQSWKIARMMQDSLGMAFTLAMADQVFRPVSEARSAEQFRYLVEAYGIPAYLPLHEKIAMKLGAVASKLMPDIVMPAVTARIHKESRNVILPSEDDGLRPHLAKRKKHGIRMNINQLGEAVLGEEEAGRRLQEVVKRLKRPDCDYISVKISAIFSQINLVAYKETLEQIKSRLRLLYRTAMKYTYLSPEGTELAKFVNLDMEEYRDLQLTCDAFKAVLMEDEFIKLGAGIVLQAYLPDSFMVQKELTEWARGRVERGGKPIKLRIVKGANLAMEAVEASVHDWPQAPYSTKIEVDANYKRMISFGAKKEHAEVVSLGVASHNLFEIAYALLLGSMHGTEAFIEFEMLEGMANHQARAVKEIADGLLLYAPVVKKQDFPSAIAYLTRRLDENTAKENYLHDLFGMKPGCPLWEKQCTLFELACDRKDEVSSEPNRTQDRASEEYALELDKPFENTANTDWSLGSNTRWIRAKVAQFDGIEIPTVPVQIAGEEIVTEIRGNGCDPSRHSAEVYGYSLTDERGVDRALECAVAAQPEWQEMGISARREILRNVAKEVAECRGESIATMVLDAGKAITEGDAEVSEAIDFANYYSDSLCDEGLFDGVAMSPFGVVVVTPPWNFPYAIPMGGVLAALMAGNTVILKPALETVLTGWLMVNQLWGAGVPRGVLQFVACPDNYIGKSLVTDERVGAVILTGGYATAKMFQDWSPKMRLFAETSGKNALIITEAADPDLAIKDLVKSAFGHAGQKCSAASLAIIEGELYDNPAFMRQLKDAAGSLQVGESWQASSVVTPVIRKPNENLERALTTLDEGEEWLLEPKMVEGNDCLWSPGIKIGVKPDSWFRKTECFGPVLGIIRAESLDHAIAIQNDSDFALTGGIHSLDVREVASWRERVEVGNAYINRSTTGAIVRRQPFGGWKKSCFGPGAKAGGPNYVAQFGVWKDVASPECGNGLSDKVDQLVLALSSKSGVNEGEIAKVAASYSHWMDEEFSIEHDPTGLHGEDNHFRYVPIKRILVRLDSPSEKALINVITASAVSGVEVDFSSETKLPSWVESFATVVEESDAQLAKRMGSVSEKYGSLRAPGASEFLARAANDAALQLVDWNVLSNGRIELLHYFREQSLSETTHRYGNIIPTPEECLIH